MVETAYKIDDKPSVVRYPRANAYGSEILRDVLGVEGEIPVRGTALPIGKGRIVKQGVTGPGRIYRTCILSIGTRLIDSVLAARRLEAEYPDTSVTVADARFMKPLDEELVGSLADSHDILVTIEEGSKGGFGDYVLHHLASTGVLDTGRLRVRTMVIPDIWIEQGPQKDQYDIAGLNEPQIVDKVAGLVQGLRAQAHDKKEQGSNAAATVKGVGAAASTPVFNSPFQQEQQ